MQPPQRIAYVINSLNHGGAESGVEFLLSTDIFADTEFYLLVLGNSRTDLQERISERLGQRLIILSQHSYRNRDLPSTALKLISALIRVRPQVVIASLTQSVLMARLARLFGHFKLVTFEHSTQYSHHGALIALRATDWLSDVFWCDSRATQLALAARSPRTTSVQVPLFAVHTGVAHEPFPRRPGRISIVSVGRLTSLKGHHKSIEVIRLLRLMGIDATLDVFGDGAEFTELRDLTRALGLETSVTLRGHDSNWTAKASDFDAYLLSSDFEGLSISTLEAMACGLPCVVRPVGEIPSYIRDGETGLIADSVDEATDCLHHLFLNPTLASQIGKRGQDLIEETFSRPHMEAHLANARASIHLSRKDAGGPARFAV